MFAHFEALRVDSQHLIKVPPPYLPRIIDLLGADLRRPEGPQLGMLWEPQEPPRSPPGAPQEIPGDLQETPRRPPGDPRRPPGDPQEPSGTLRNLQEPSGSLGAHPENLREATGTSQKTSRTSQKTTGTKNLYTIMSGVAKLPIARPWRPVC